MKPWADRQWEPVKGRDNPQLADDMAEPVRWEAPMIVSMGDGGDLLHPAVESIRRMVFWTMQNTDHIYQFTTDHPERIVVWPKCVWLGVEVEDADTLYRLLLLKETICKLRWVIWRANLNLLRYADMSHIDWLVFPGDTVNESHPSLWLAKNERAKETVLWTNDQPRMPWDAAMSRAKGKHADGLKAIRDRWEGSREDDANGN